MLFGALPYPPNSFKDRTELYRCVEKKGLKGQVGPKVRGLPEKSSCMLV